MYREVVLRNLDSSGQTRDTEGYNNTLDFKKYAALTSYPIGDQDGVFVGLPGLLVARWGSIDLSVSLCSRSGDSFRDDGNLVGDLGAGWLQSWAGAVGGGCFLCGCGFGLDRLGG
jgi:hypothetical protein